MARPPKEYAEFVKLTDKALSVSRADLQSKIDAHKAKSAANPNRTGRKKKATSSGDTAFRDENAYTACYEMLGALSSAIGRLHQDIETR